MWTHWGNLYEAACAFLHWTRMGGEPTRDTIGRAADAALDWLKKQRQRNAVHEMDPKALYELYRAAEALATDPANAISYSDFASKPNGMRLMAAAAQHSLSVVISRHELKGW